MSNATALTRARKQTLNMTLDVDVLERLEKVSKEHGTSKSSVVNTVLRRHFELEATPALQAEDLK
jgi:hypothetical protein